MPVGLDYSIDPSAVATIHARGAECAAQNAICSERSSGSQQLSRRWSQQLSRRWSQHLSWRWQAEVINDLDDIWEDDDGLFTSPPPPAADLLRQRQEAQEGIATGIGETSNHHLPSTVNGLPVTTLMLRNLPEHVTQDSLLRILPKPKNAKYNLLYVPEQRSGTHRPGSAFLNFEAHEDAVAFCRAWHGREIEIPSGDTGSSSQVEIEAAKTQGLVVNMLRWRTKLRNLSDSAKLPAVFFRGQRQDFWGYVTALQNFIRGRTIERNGVTYAFNC